MKKYDVVIIGGGISGLMAAYMLRTENKDLEICIIEKGKMLSDRICPSAKNHSGCIHCKICDITNGFSGSGGFSDSKYNLGTTYGGTLGDELGEQTAMYYINTANDVLNNFISEGVDIPIIGTDESLKLKCLQHNLQLLDMNVRHFGTDNNFYIMNRLIKWLYDHGVELIPNTEILEINEQNDGEYCLSGENKKYFADRIIIATGRNGAEFVQNICKQFSIPVISNAVDIGVRVEMKDAIWQEFSSRIYEPKILYRTKTFEDKTRLFCFNQGGIVSAENNGGVITANGHAFSNVDKKTENCNFAILSSINFTEPFNDPTAYAKSLSMIANLIGNGNVLVQRFGDLIRGRRTNDHRLSQNTVKPTLNATAGDLSLALPHRILTNIIETIYAINKVAPGSANDDTLLYGLESKYYSIKPKHDKTFMIYDNIYLIGDGAGIARGLSQSAAMGLYVANVILNNKRR